jgi:molybdenum cofactor cytidylyltransferase
MTVTTIVLAAGRGVRLGGPKALLAWPSESGRLVPLAAVHAAVRRSCESDRVLIVTRADIGAALAGHAPDLAAELVVSTAPDDDGPAGSIAAAYDLLAAEHSDSAAGEALPGDLILITPVDCPPVCARTAQALLDRLGERPELLAARPKHGPRRGHPVVLRLTALAAYGAAHPPPLRDLLRELGDRVADVELDDEGVLLDIDGPEQWAAWAAGQGHPSAPAPRFFWP